MTFDERFVRIRGHVDKRHQCDWVELERDLDRLQAEIAADQHANQAALAQVEAELAELLRRTPDARPTRVTVTAH